MSVIFNQTPFEASTFSLLDQNAQALQIVVLSATFEAKPGKPVQPADVQAPIHDSDVFYGQPGLSSIRYEGEVAWEKPRVDVIINGTAYAPGGRPADRVAVVARVGDIHKQLFISGDRTWGSRLLGYPASSPSTFLAIPLVYERAFGGIDMSNPAKPRHDMRNPVGLGYRGAISPDPNVKTQVPNIEYPSQLISSQRDTPEPAGFGAVTRSWHPRLKLAGTYDDAWKADRAPLLPDDFDVEHFQSAPLDQQSQTICGGEPVELHNLTPDGFWKFSLPTLDVPARLRFSNRIANVNLRLDTVIIEPDMRRIVLLARAAVTLVRNRAPLEEIVLGHLTSAWWRARNSGRKFLDRAKTGGTIVGTTCYKL